MGWMHQSLSNAIGHRIQSRIATFNLKCGAVNDLSADMKISKGIAIKPLVHPSHPSSDVIMQLQG
jgi:hypothetical protein